MGTLTRPWDAAEVLNSAAAIVAKDTLLRGNRVLG